MAIASYANVNITVNSAVTELLSTINDIVDDLATIVVTTSNSGIATAEGSFEITETFGANAGFFTGGIRGGDANTTSTLNVLNGMGITGDLTVSGNTTLTGDLNVSGAFNPAYIEMEGSYIDANAGYFTGGISGGTSENTAPLTVLSNTTFNGIATFAANTAFTGKISATNVEVDSTLYVDTAIKGGNTSAAANLSITSNASFTQELKVTGTSVIAGTTATVTANATFNSDVVFANNSSVTFESLVEDSKFLSKEVSLSGNSSPITVDITEGSAYELVLSEDTTVDFDASGLSSVSSDQIYTFRMTFVQDSGGNQYTVDLSNNSISWSYGIAPVFSSSANKKDVLVFETSDQGNTYIGYIAGQDI